MSAYSEKLKDPRWLRVSSRIQDRDKWTCRHCRTTSKRLHVHHGYYRFGVEPWEYPDSSLHTLCEDCHAIADQLREETQELMGRMQMGQLQMFRDVMRKELGVQEPVPVQNAAEWAAAVWDARLKQLNYHEHRLGLPETSAIHEGTTSSEKLAAAVKKQRALQRLRELGDTEQTPA